MMVLPIFLIAVLSAAADQITKLIAVTYLPEKETVNILKAGDTEILSFSRYHNTGAAFGTAQGKTVFLITVTAVLMVFLVWYIARIKPKSKFPLICTAAVIGGGIGNLIDRIRLGYVIDFIILFPFDFIFNIADVCVVIGAILLAVYFVFIEKEDAPEEENKDE